MFPNLNKLVDNHWALKDGWQFYTVNVKYLGTLTHEQFCEEFPETAREIAKVSEQMGRLARLLEE